MGSYKYALLGSVVGIVIIEIGKSYNLSMSKPLLVIVALIFFAKYMLNAYKNKKSI